MEGRVLGAYGTGVVGKSVVALRKKRHAVDSCTLNRFHKLGRIPKLANIGNLWGVMKIEVKLPFSYHVMSAFAIRWFLVEQALE